MAKPGKNRVSLEARRGGHYDAGAEYARNTIGKKLAEGRRRRGLSQGEFASLLGDFGIRIGLRGYAKWETGETVPNAYQLLALCRALEPAEGPAWLFGEETLNAEGQKKLMQYREDLIASGRYKPAALAEDNAVVWREALFSRLRPSAGPGNFLEEENFEKRLFPASSIPQGADFAVCVDGPLPPPPGGGGGSFVLRRQQLYQGLWGTAAGRRTPSLVHRFRGAGLSPAGADLL